MLFCDNHLFQMHKIYRIKKMFSLYIESYITDDIDIFRKRHNILFKDMKKSRLSKFLMEDEYIVTFFFRYSLFSLYLLIFDL